MNYAFVRISHSTGLHIAFGALSGSCGTPHYLSYGQRSYSSTTVGSSVTYTCNTGYRMTAGSSSRTLFSEWKQQYKYKYQCVCVGRCVNGWVGVWLGVWACVCEHIYVFMCEGV